MRLASISSPARPRAAAIIGDDVLDLAMAERLLPIARWIPPSMNQLIAGGPEGLDIVRRVVGAAAEAAPALAGDLRETGALASSAEVRLAAPVPDPGILLSHARAYRDHLAEMGSGEEAPRYPVGFMKNANSIVGSGTPIRLPASAADMVDFEGEMSVVFSRPCHGVAAADALDHVLGVTIVNDVSARDWMTDIRTFPDRNRMGKQFATFSPMGPWITTWDDGMTMRSSQESQSDRLFAWQNWALARLHAEHAREPIFYYRFAQEPPAPAMAGMDALGAFHSGELPYTLRNLGKRDWPWRDADRALCETMSGYWLDFARTGDPNGGGRPPWPRFEAERRARMVFAEGRAASERTPHSERMALLDDFLRLGAAYGRRRLAATGIATAPRAALRLRARRERYPRRRQLC